MHVSASQISTFRDCKRKWAWRVIAGIKTPQHPSAALGTEVDDTQLQPLLRENRPLDFDRVSGSGYIAATAQPYLPAFGSNYSVQQEVSFPSPNGDWSYKGFIDLWLPDDKTVIDFKTTGNWKYVKTPADLAVDVQAQIYAFWALWKTRADAVNLQWVYMHTKMPYKAASVLYVAEKQHVAEQFQAIEETAAELVQLRLSKTDPLSLPPTLSACTAYGGCPYKANCGLGLEDTLELMFGKKETIEMAVTSDSTESLVSRMKRNKAPAPATAPVQQELFINPPEAALPPAPLPDVLADAPAPIAAVEQPEAEPKKRGRKARVEAEAEAETNPADAPSAEDIKATAKVIAYLLSKWAA